MLLFRIHAICMHPEKYIFWVKIGERKGINVSAACREKSKAEEVQAKKDMSEYGNDEAAETQSIRQRCPCFCVNNFIIGGITWRSCISAMEQWVLQRQPMR